MTPKPPTVRIAGARDADELFALIWTSQDEWALTPRSSEKVRRVVHLATTRDDVVGTDGSPVLRPTFGVIDGEHGVIGGVGLYPTSQWDSEQFFLRCFFLFVHPGARRSIASAQIGRPALTAPNSHARHLFEFAKWFGERAGLSVVFEILHPDRTEAKVRLARRHAPMVGGLFMHVPAVALEKAA